MIEPDPLLQHIDAARAALARTSRDDANAAEADRHLAALRDRLLERDMHLRHQRDLSGHIHWISDEHGKVMSISQLEQVTGLSSEAALGAGWVAVVHPEDMPRYREIGRDAVQRRAGFDITFRARMANGDYRWLRSRTQAREGHDGRLYRYGMAEDVHEQVLAQESMQEVTERYRLAARATNDVIWDWDLKTGHIQWNEAMSTLTSVDTSVGVGDLDWWSERVHPADRERVTGSLEAAVAEEREYWRSNYRFLRADGSYGRIYDRGYVLRNADNVPVRMIGAMTDLTERDEAEKKLEQLQAELLHVSRLSAMGAMATTLAHELNQPLAAASNWVTAATSLLGKRGDTPPEILDALAEGRAMILRAGDIIRRMRGFLSGSAVGKQTEDLRAVIDEAVGLLRAAHPDSGTDVTLDVPPVKVSVDRVQVQQVLANLLRNANEAMQDTDERKLTIRAAPGEENVEVVISDTGAGLDDGAGSLFQPFQTSKPSGMGVGLSISRTIVEAHGGRIWLEPNGEQGTSAHFTLPLAPRERSQR